MLQRRDLHVYQARAVDHILSNPQSMLWLDMGLGKTVSTLTAIVDLFNAGVTMGVLVIAPLRVAQSVWEQEALKWEHTKHLTFSLIHGPEDTKSRQLRKPAHVYLINYEGLPWLENKLNKTLFSKGLMPRFDTVVFDEITRLKNTRAAQFGEHGGVRGNALLSFLGAAQRCIGLTGTPSPNGMLDLFGQYLVLDGGERLGRTEQSYRERFFYQGMGWDKPIETKAGQTHIHSLIADITLQMKGEDYLTLPKVIENIIHVDLPPALMGKYRKLEMELFLELDSGATIEAVNTLALMNKCLQFANGGMYLVPGEPEWETVHKYKLDALEEVYDSHGQQPLLIAYQYRHDVERIVKRFKKRGRTVVLDSRIKGADVTQIINDWNAGEIDFLIGHPASMGHGLNLQFGSNHVALFGMGHNLEWYLQFVGRVARQGQPKDHVFVHKILCDDTLDMMVLDSITGKEGGQQSLRDAVDSYRKERGL